MKTSNCTECYYSASNNAIIDVIRPDTGLSWFCNDTLESMRDRYPDAVIMDIDKAADLKEGHYKAAPKQITEAQFHDMLECLPPMDYRCANGWTTFKMCELTCGNITGIYATNGDKYYAMQDSQFLRHADIVSKITEVQP